MPIFYDSSLGEAVTKLGQEQAAHKASVKDYLKKVKDGYFVGTDVIVKSGLTKAEVQRILGAQKAARALEGKIKAADTKFKAALLNAYNESKSEHEKALAALKGEYEAELKKYRVSSSWVVGDGPEQDFKKSLPLLK